MSLTSAPQSSLFFARPTTFSGPWQALHTFISASRPGPVGRVDCAGAPIGQTRTAARKINLIPESYQSETCEEFPGNPIKRGFNDSGTVMPSHLALTPVDATRRPESSAQRRRSGADLRPVADRVHPAEKHPGGHRREQRTEYHPT